jgi:hypothetical protein
LKWQVTNVDELILNGIGVRGKGSRIEPKAKTKFTLIARNALFEDRKTIEVDVFPLPKEPGIRIPQIPEMKDQPPLLEVEMISSEEDFNYQGIWEL